MVNAFLTLSPPRFVVTMITTSIVFLLLLVLMIFTLSSWIVSILVLLRRKPALMLWSLLVILMVPLCNGFEMRERSGSHEQLRPLASGLVRRIPLLDGCTLRAWSHFSS